MQLMRYNTRNDHPLTLAFIGDIQWIGKPELIAYNHFKDYLVEANQKDAMYIGMGDYTDFASPSNRKALAGSGLYDTAKDVIRTAAKTVVDGLYADLLSPTTGRWLAMLEGHHYLQLEGQTTDQYLAELLGAPFAGTCCNLHLEFSHGKHTGSIDVWLHHGPARMVQNPANYLQTKVFPYWDAHIFAMGHVPKIESKVLDRVYTVYTKGVGRLQHREVRVIGTGGWAKAYIEGTLRGDYAEQAMYSPASLGAPMVEIEPRWENGSWDPMIKVVL